LQRLPIAPIWAGMVTPSPLDDPRNAAFAWARYRRMMRWSGLATLAVSGTAVALLYRSNGLVSIHFYIATVLGIGITMMLTAALMGLVFLSHGTGHDDSITDLIEEERNR
jgi:hypothetical protein